MNDGERVRLEIAFGGPQILTVAVPLATADELDRALGDGHTGAWSFDAEDGRYTIALPAVLYVRRFAREGRVGFGTVV